MDVGEIIASTNPRTGRWGGESRRGGCREREEGVVGVAAVESRTGKSWGGSRRQRGYECTSVRVPKLTTSTLIILAVGRPQLVMRDQARRTKERPSFVRVWVRVGGMGSGWRMDDGWGGFLARMEGKLPLDLRDTTPRRQVSFSGSGSDHTHNRPGRQASAEKSRKGWWKEKRKECRGEKKAR